MILNDRKLRPAARLLLAVPAAALAFSLVACGGASRPSTADVAEGLSQVFEDQGLGDAMTDDMAECFAGHLVDSELSNETLAYIADGEDKQKDEADKALTTKIIQDNTDECVAPQ